VVGRSSVQPRLPLALSRRRSCIASSRCVPACPSVLPIVGGRVGRVAAQLVETAPAPYRSTLHHRWCPVLVWQCPLPGLPHYGSIVTTPWGFSCLRNPIPGCLSATLTVYTTNLPPPAADIIIASLPSTPFSRAILCVGLGAETSFPNPLPIVSTGATAGAKVQASRPSR